MRKIFVRRIFDVPAGLTPCFDENDGSMLLIAHYDITRKGACLLERALTQHAQGWTLFDGARPEGWAPPRIEVRCEARMPGRQQIRIEQGEDALVYLISDRLITEAGARGLQEEFARKVWRWERIAGPVSYLLPGATRS